MIKLRLLATLFCPVLLAACAAAPTTTAPCKVYCISHEDGYQWAGRANLSDARPCGGYSAEFEDGCRQAVQDAKLAASPREGY